jgi:hypothetical protein
MIGAAEMAWVARAAGTAIGRIGDAKRNVCAAKFRRRSDALQQRGTAIDQHDQPVRGFENGRALRQ